MYIYFFLKKYTTNVYGSIRNICSEFSKEIPHVFLIEICPRTGLERGVFPTRPNEVKISNRAVQQIKDNVLTGTRIAPKKQIK